MRPPAANYCSKQLDESTSRFCRCLVCRLCGSRFAQRLPPTLPKLFGAIFTEAPDLLGEGKKVPQA
jgi:hypothetical protein